LTHKNISTDERARSHLDLGTLNLSVDTRGVQPFRIINLRSISINEGARSHLKLGKINVGVDVRGAWPFKSQD
jgi:hypothetical protein